MTKLYLPGIGDVYFEKTGSAKTSYTAIIADYLLDGAKVYLTISSTVLNEHTINKIEAIISQLKKMNSTAKQAYLDDFNDEEEAVYTDSIYRAFLSEAELASWKQQTTPEQWLLFSVNLASIDIDLSRENTPVVFSYIKGYELMLSYKFSQDYKLKEMTLKPGASIVKEQLAAFIDTWEQPEVDEICSRFSKDWHNYPIKSYFIYLMAKRIRSLSS